MNTDINKTTFIDKISPKNINKRALLIITFFTAVLLIFSSYAWFSTSLDVRVDFFNLSVSSDTGLFISLDGIDFGESIEVSVDSIIVDLKRTYPNHTNQWAAGGLWPVSSNGIRDTNSNKFDIYIGEIIKNKGRDQTGKKYLNTILTNETNSNSSNVFMAFDVFLKNVSGSPNSDNLYFDEGTYVDYDYEKFEDYDEEYINEIIHVMSGIMNSMRIGIVKMGSVPSTSTINTIQNIPCNNRCEMAIYEPNSLLHSPFSIEAAEQYGITLVDNTYVPTYGIIKNGKKIDHLSGHVVELNHEHFRLQQTTTDFDNPIFQIPNGITKCRIYVWIEGQDVDSLETHSKGASIAIAINLTKDLAGYY